MEKTALIEFYNARDQFLGQGNYRNWFNSDSSFLGLQRLRKCQHPEAIYICLLFKKYDNEKNKLWITDFVNVLEKDFRDTDNLVTLCYFGIIMSGYDSPSLELIQAAKRGHPFALANMANRSILQRLHFGNMASKLGDRLGSYELGVYYRLEGKTELAALAFKQSAELGLKSAMIEYACLAFNKTDPGRYLWLSRADLAGIPGTSLLSSICENWWILKDCFDVYFVIGRALKNHVYKFMRWSEELVGWAKETKPLALVGWAKEIQPLALQSIALHTDWCERAKESTLCWLMITKHSNVRPFICKDVAFMIACRVWDFRSVWSI